MLVLCVNLCFFLPEALDAEAGCGDLDDVDGGGVWAAGAGALVAGFEDHKFPRVVALFVEVVDSSAHIGCWIRSLDWVLVGLRDLEWMM